MLDLVEFLADQPRGYGINELARELDVPVNSVFRILKCLEERDYVELHDGGYQLSTSFFSLGMRLYSRFELRRRARKHLEWLCHETGETCQLHVPKESEVLVVDVATPDDAVFLQIVPGNLMDYHPNAFGKAILAHLSEERIERILAKPLPALTPNTITDPRALLAELDEGRRTGLFYDREEYTLGIYCVGASVFNAEHEVVAGVGVTGLVSRLDEAARKKAEQNVLKAAAAISAELGHRP